MNSLGENLCLDFCRTYTLKASTPLIHFQYAEFGATLRATEAKPKLDKYLKEKAKGAIKDGWFIAGTGAFDYKLRIVSCSARVVELGYKTDYPNYYGSKEKKGVIADSELTVICFIPELLELIDKYIGEFFATNNFGTMSGKGFGSFFVEEKPLGREAVAKALKEKCGARRCYMFTSPNPFKDVDRLYKRMKSGFQGRFSLLFKFAEEYGFINEKEWLVVEGLSPVGSADEKPEDYEYAFVRALLGLASHYSYMKQKKKVTIEDVEKDKEKRVERLPSPIFFKIRRATGTQYEVFVVANRINEEIYGKSFRFSSGDSGAILDVPTADDLGDDFIDEFMEFVSSCKDLGVKLTPVI